MLLFGPFSFALYRDIEALGRDGHLDVAKEHVSLRQPGSLAFVLAAKVREAIRSIVATYAKLPNTGLLRLVYERYPWYASRSERQDLRPKGTSSPWRKSDRVEAGSFPPALRCRTSEYSRYSCGSAP